MQAETKKTSKTNRVPEKPTEQRQFADVSVPLADQKSSPQQSNIFRPLIDNLENPLRTSLAEDLSEGLVIELDSPQVTFDEKYLTFVFIPETSFFDPGHVSLRPSLQRLLTKFFPKFVSIIDTYKNEIIEVRFQGYSSSIWKKAIDPTEVFLKNMALSTGRAESSMKFCLNMPGIKENYPWIIDRLVSSGFSDRKPVLNENRKEDPNRSRRIGISVLLK